MYYTHPIKSNYWTTNGEFTEQLLQLSLYIFLQSDKKNYFGFIDQIFHPNMSSVMFEIEM